MKRLAYNKGVAEKPTLEQRIEKLEARNRRVEGDKAWETSWTRRLSITVLTYLTLVFYLRFIAHIYPWIDALVASLGYFVSTLTIGFFKQRWLAHRKR